MIALEKAVVAILNKHDRICGTGFLVTERLIITCAHVVEKARQAGQVIKGRFHLDASTQELTVVAGGWFPEQDVAILSCEADPPRQTQPLSLGNSQNCDGHGFITLGYPMVGDYLGIPARGVIDGRAAKENGQILLKLSSADVAQGHSGAPLFDETSQKVVGMVREVFHPTATTKHRDAAFAVPVEVIWQLLPELSPRQQDANPFYVGGRINDPAQFFGRDRLLRQVKSYLHNRDNVSIVGESQIGKSSLLYYLYRTGQEWQPQARVVYVDLQGVWDQEDFFSTILEKLGHSGNSPSQLRRKLLQSDTILLLDEFEQLIDPDFTPKLRSLLRSVAQERQVALCIASQKPLDELFVTATTHVSPFHNIFTVKRMTPFSPESASTFLRTRLAATHVQFSDGEIEMLLQESKRHPAKLQALAWQLFQHYMD